MKNKKHLFGRVSLISNTLYEQQLLSRNGKPVT